MCRRRPARIHVSAHTPSPSYISILPCAQHRGQVKCCNETPVRIRGFYILACNHYAGVGAGITFNRTFGAILGTRPAAVPATTDGAKSIEKLSTAPPPCAELREAQKVNRDQRVQSWNTFINQPKSRSWGEDIFNDISAGECMFPFFILIPALINGVDILRHDPHTFASTFENCWGRFFTPFKDRIFEFK
jgi:hypothetical protein